MPNSEDVQAQLERAVAEESDSSTDTQENVTSTEAKTDDGTIPRSRYNEVSTKLKEATAAWEAEKQELGSKLDTATQKAQELAEAVAKSRDDTELVAALRTLARNPEHAELIARVDAALAGEDYEADSDDSDEDEKSPVDRKSLMKEIRGELEEALEEQRQEVILQQTDLLAKEYMRQLPAEKYSDNDKEIIAELWANKVDWDEVKSSPKDLGNILSRTLEETLERFDTLRPAPVESGDSEGNNTNQTTSEPTIEQEIEQILGRPWGSVKEVDGKTVAELSDSEFDQAFGKLFKNLNVLNS